MTWDLKTIAEHIGGIVQGDDTLQVDSFGTLQNAEKNQISFLSNTKYKKYLADSQAGAIIVNADMAEFVLSNAIIVTDPYVAYAKAATLLNPNIIQQQGIHPTAVISPTSQIDTTVSIAANVVIDDNVEIAADVVIGAGCIIQQGVKIGKGTRLTSNITLCHEVQLGQDCLIHPGAVIGADGFGIANDKGKWIKVPQIGRVIIGDDVEIGANTTIDRGAMENTIIANGVKIDNQVQIAHNVVIGENTVIAGCSGVAGSTTIGENCIIAGAVAVTGHINITDNVVLMGMTMVTKSISQPGPYSSGIPAEPTKQWHRNIVRYRQMDKLVERVKTLELAQQQDK